MKTKSRFQENNARRYAIGETQTPVGPAKHVVWSTQVVGVVTQPHMIGVKLYTGETIWCSDTDEDVQRLIKDRRTNGGR